MKLKMIYLLIKILLGVYRLITKFKKNNQQQMLSSKPKEFKKLTPMEVALMHDKCATFCMEGIFFKGSPLDTYNSLYQNLYLVYLASIGDVGSVNSLLMEGILPTFTASDRILKGIIPAKFKTSNKEFKVYGNYFGVQDTPEDKSTLISLIYALVYATSSPKMLNRIDHQLITKFLKQIADKVVDDQGKIAMYATGSSVDTIVTDVLLKLVFSKLLGSTKEYRDVYKTVKPILESIDILMPSQKDTMYIYMLLDVLCNLSLEEAKTVTDDDDLVAEYAQYSNCMFRGYNHDPKPGYLSLAIYNDFEYVESDELASIQLLPLNKSVIVPELEKYMSYSNLDYLLLNSLIKETTND